MPIYRAAKRPTTNTGWECWHTTLRRLKHIRFVVDGCSDNMPIANAYRDRSDTKWGERDAVAGTDTNAGRDQNRRIKVTLVGRA